MTIALRLAGFEVRDVIEWLYFSGFPKSMDVGKAFDRRRTEDIEPILSVTRWTNERVKQSGRKYSEILSHFGFNEGSGQVGHWVALSKGAQPTVPTWEQWGHLKAFCSMSDEMDAEVWRLNGRKGKPGDAWENASIVGEYEGTPGGFGDHRFQVSDNLIRSRSTDLAKQWDGWGTALKPAHEPIIVVRKPLAGTVADTVEKYGTGALNIDGCRIPTDDKLGGGMVSKGRPQVAGTGWDRPWMHDEMVTVAKKAEAAAKVEKAQELGRFPANAITTDADAFYSPYFNVSPQEVSKKASKKDRNADWTGAEIGIEPKNNMRVNAPRANEEAKHATTQRNSHPTVKPTDIMAWLVRLVTPPGGTVLDPFAGSGSTLVAAKREGFQFIGIEREADYIEIIKSRTGA
jgi:hypothetical protein